MPILGIGRNTAYELVRSGQIRSIKIGRQIRVPRDAVGKLITAGAVTDGKLDLSYDMLRLIVIGLRFTRHAR